MYKFRKKTIPLINTILIVVTLLINSGNLKAQQTVNLEKLQNCDLIFVSDTSGMGEAVMQTTGVYTHVAMVERAGDSIFIIDATQKHGVAKRPLEHTFAARMPVDVYRMAVPIDTAEILARAHALLGCPYDNTFLPGNNAYYCSELIQSVFIINDKPVFQSAPMNWRDSRNRLPRYWKNHFKKLGMKVPEGVLGTNPTGISKDGNLKKVEAAE